MRWRYGGLAMGQPVVVVEKPSRRPGLKRYEANRSLTGMGHEHYDSVEAAYGTRPADELARRLFATGEVESIHVFSNMITVDLAAGSSGNGLDEVIADLYQYWKPGVEPPSFDDLQAGGDDAGDTAVTAAVDGGDAALSEAAKRVPAHLLERSRSARERWKAKQGG
jgi:hypothetical protein